MNTFGLRSINTDTFNIILHSHEGITFPRPARNVIVTTLRVHNAVFNILGYIPGVSVVSGSIRILTGIVIIAGTIAVGNPHARKGAIIGHWYSEAIHTGIAQIVRGAFEAFVPMGNMVNLVLDIGCTFVNIGYEVNACMREATSCSTCMYGGGCPEPHEEVSYPFPLWLLYLV